MKKSVVLSVLLIVSILTFSAVLMTAGCSNSDEKNEAVTSVDDGSDEYIVRLNQALVSFTDCANQFSDSLEQVAESKSVPSDAQISAIDSSLGKLERACENLDGIDAPERYSQAQQAINSSMSDYRTAIDKCRALLDFYRGYDEQFRKYKDPAKCSAKMREKGTALYDDFAQAMKQATDSFRSANEAYNSVKR